MITQYLIIGWKKIVIITQYLQDEENYNYYTYLIIGWKKIIIITQYLIIGWNSHF